MFTLQLLRDGGEGRPMILTERLTADVLLRHPNEFRLVKDVPFVLYPNGEKRESDGQRQRQLEPRRKTKEHLATAGFKLISNTIVHYNVIPAEQRTNAPSY